MSIVHEQIVEELEEYASELEKCKRDILKKCELLETVLRECPVSVLESQADKVRTAEELTASLRSDMTAVDDHLRLVYRKIDKMYSYDF